MMSNSVRIALVALCLLCHAQWADAGFLSAPYVATTPGSPVPAPSDYYGVVSDDGSQATLYVSETWSEQHGSMYSFDVWGLVDEDPPLRIIKEVTNGTSFPWIGYKLALDPADPHTFELSSPAPTSDMFTWDSGNSDAYNLLFGQPGRVDPGETVMFDFTVNITFTGPSFNFTLTQMPIAVPEPAVGALMLAASAIGAMVYRRRKA